MHTFGIYIIYTWNMEAKIRTKFGHQIAGVAERGAGSDESTKGFICI